MVLRERTSIVLPVDHPQTSAKHIGLDDLADLPWAACQPGTGHYEMHLRACRDIGRFEPDVRYTSDDFTILLELVRTTGAGALLPDLVVRFDAPGVAVRPFKSGKHQPRGLPPDPTEPNPHGGGSDGILMQVGKHASSHRSPPDGA